MRYWVEWMTGGRIYCDTLREAIECADGWGVNPYVHSARGARPVIWSDDGGYILGDYGQSYDDLKTEYDQ